MKSTLRSFIINALGSKQTAAISHRLAQIGMLGLGVDVGSEFETNGEQWFSRRLFGAIPGAVCADVGANVGEYTATALAMNASHVFAFEPSPAIFDVLKSQFGDDSRVTLLKTAIGEETGEVSFYVPINNASTFASRDVAITPIASSTSQKITVLLTTLDQISEKEKVAFDVVKIDVEGFELEVLKGAQRMLRSKPPKVIQFEFNTHHGKRRQTMQDFADALPDFKMFRLASRSLRPIDLGHHFSTIYAYQNIICIYDDPRLLSRLT
jgi:FkbM family methyltransferase